MIKPPSLVSDFTLVWSHDPALDLPSDPEERARLLKLARETGNWPLRDGHAPTLFHFRDLSREEIGWWRGECASSTIYGRPLSDVEQTDLLIRLTIRGADNFGKVKTERKNAAKGIQLAPMEFIEALHAAAPTALGEFADVLIERMREHIRPLS